MTNYSGIEWVQRQLGGTYKVHILNFLDRHAFHIDASMFIPRPGVVVLNPKLQFSDCDFFERAGWKVRTCYSFSYLQKLSPSLNVVT